MNKLSNIMFISRSLILILQIFLIQFQLSASQSQQEPTTMNGGSILAMAGDNCVAVAVDKRFGIGPQMVNISPRKIMIPHSRLLIGFTGLEGDVQSLSQELSIQISTKIGRHIGFGCYGASDDEIYGHHERTMIRPSSMSTLLSHVLYGQRQSPFYVEPIVAGLEILREQDSTGDSCETKYRPYLCAFDVIGAKSFSTSFVCSGTASKSIYGTAEAMWSPGLPPQDLARVCGKAFISALERDCLSGYGAVVYLMIGGDGVYQYDIACRND